MGLKVADLFAELSLKDHGFDQQLDRKKGLLGGLGPMAAKAGAAVGVGLAAGAATAVASFSGFQRQMNEVFTLLPGISGDAMTQMEGQVKDFSKTFGVLPDQVVPALYQSLSAGVPPGNVFEFLETAQAAAKGGVTDLATAVNGISGVVNAYGADAMDAGKASDLMFTAVRLGKTTFEEMSASLGDVTPIAAAMGVSFEEVTGALAASTSITNSTGKSVTGLKSLLGELGKEGQIAAQHFEHAAGKSFPDFIAEGGSLAGALDIMKDAAAESGGSIMDLFGGIEAGQAALQLTGSDTFVKNVDAMAGSAGATQAAFETMEQGIAPVWDKLKANAAVALLELGDRLAPVIETLGNLALNALPAVANAFTTLWSFIEPVVTAISDAITGLADGTVGGAAETISGLLGADGPVALAIATFQELFATARDFVADHMGQVQEIIGGVLEAVSFAWGLFGDDILQFVTSTFNAILTIIGGVLDVIMGVINTVLGVLTGDWSRAWDGLKQIVSGFGQVIEGIIGRIMATIRLVVGAGFDLLRTLWDSSLGKLVAGASDMAGNVVDWFSRLPGMLLDALGNLGDLLVDAGKDILQGLWNGLKAKWTDVKGWVGGLGDKIKDLKGPIEVDRRLLINEGQAIMGGFGKGLAQAWQPVAGQLDAIAGKVGEAMQIQMPTMAAPLPVGVGATGGRERLYLVLEDGTQLGGYVDRKVGENFADGRRHMRAGT